VYYIKEMIVVNDDILMRAITIGASVFITLATVTAVMMYYNVAKTSVTNIGTGTNIEEKYREDIKNTLYNTEATGSEVKNILQYFFENNEVDITITRYYAYYGNTDGYMLMTVPAGSTDRINVTKSPTYTNIMKAMMPNQKFRITSNGSKYTFDLIL
jgi:hypothetical protein